LRILRILHQTGGSKMNISVDMIKSNVKSNVRRAKKGKVFLLVGLVGIGLGVMLPDAAFATQSLGEIGQNVGNNANGLGEGLRKIFIFLGFVMAGVGMLTGFMAHKKHESATTGILTFAAGVLLIALPMIIGSGSTTIFGSDTSSAPLNNIGLTN
jgi:uncharacterized membrane protein